MRRPWTGAFGLCLALTLAPTLLEAQGRTCRQVLPSDFHRIMDARGGAIFYFRDPVRFLCSGNVRLEADSAVVNRATSTVELVGHVVYRDSTRELTADWANYLGRMSQLLARGSAAVRDLENGAVVEGENLNYLRETDDRPVARMIVTGGRPHAIIPPQSPDDARGEPEREDPAAPEAGDLPPLPVGREPAREGGPELSAEPASTEPDSAALPTDIWADRMELEGQGVFRAQGNVELERGSMVGGGESAVFDRAEEQMTLTGGAFVENEEYRLQGDRIDALLEGEGLREVLSEGRSVLTSADLDVRGERVRIAFTAGTVERLEAWNPEPAATAPRARANARDFHLRADSIHAQADSMGLRELRAIGRAYGERVDGTEAMESDRVLPPALARDWLQGDTLLAFFTRLPSGSTSDPEDLDPLPGGADGEAPDDVVLERIIVVGGEGHALSLYRMAPEDGAGSRSVNFMRASRIVLFMEQGDVARVEAEGPIEGLYLDPVGGAGRGADVRPEAVGVEQGGTVR